MHLPVGLAGPCARPFFIPGLAVQDTQAAFVLTTVYVTAMQVAESGLGIKRPASVQHPSIVKDNHFARLQLERHQISRVSGQDHILAVCPVVAGHQSGL